MAVDPAEDTTRRPALCAQPPPASWERRSAAGLGICLGLGVACTAAAAAAGPIVVLGANGKTGRQCVLSALQRDERVVATSRTGVLRELDACAPPRCEARVGDVTRLETLRAVVSGARGVIFAASQSKEGGSARAVDNQGLVNTARACIDAGVQRLVVVSSGAVSRPDSSVYQFLNLFGNIMAEKIAGENQVRALYADAARSGGGVGYTIVRPGGLTEAAGRGAGAVELGQGDAVSGRISRADVAELSLAAVDSPSSRNATVECYYADTAKPLQAVGLSNVLGLTSAEREGSGLRGASWEALLAGVRADLV